MREARSTDARPSTGGPKWSKWHPLRAVAWGSAYYLVGTISLMATAADQPLVLIFPSAGLGVIWFSTATRASVPDDGAALTAAVIALSLQFDLPWWLALLNPVALLLQFGLFVVLMRRWTPHLVPFGGSSTTWRLRDLGYFLIATAATTLLSAIMLTGLQVLAGLTTAELTTIAVRWGRDAAAICSVGGLGLFALSALHPDLHSGGWRRVLTALSTIPNTRVAEGAALTTASVSAYFLVFDALEGYPLTFLLFVMTVWAGARFTPLTAAAHAVGFGAVAVGYTLGNNGGFALVEDPSLRALYVQLFVVSLTTTGLALAVARAELREAQRLVARRAVLLDQVLNGLDAAVVVLAAPGIFVFANPAARRILGLDSESTWPAMRRPYDLFDLEGHSLAAAATPFTRVLRGETVNDVEILLRWRDGSRSLAIRASGYPMPDVDSEGRQRALVSFRDITSERERLEALTTFAGHVAHDLRNPLMIVQSWNEELAHALSDGRAIEPEEGLAMVSRIGKAAQRMSDFIGSLLNFTLARDRELRPEHVDLIQVAEDVAVARATTPPHVETPLITVTGSGNAHADPVLIRIVIDNLVANAIKFVTPGVIPKVVITVHDHGKDDVMVTIADNGVGIPLDQRGRVFETFHRLENRAAEGTGLGLDICRRIVARHEGSIGIVDTVQGTAVEFSLPRTPAA